MPRHRSFHILMMRSMQREKQLRQGLPMMALTSSLCFGPAQSLSVLGCGSHGRVEARRKQNAVDEWTRQVSGQISGLVLSSSPESIVQEWRKTQRPELENSYYFSFQLVLVRILIIIINGFFRSVVRQRLDGKSHVLWKEATAWLWTLALIEFQI